MWGRIVTWMLAIIVGLFLGFPAPPLPDDVGSMRRQGSYFWHTGEDGTFAIFYRDIIGQNGNGKPKTLLLIHGMPVSSYDWKKILPGLRKDFMRIIVPDLLGAGFSDKPENHNYNVMEHADILEKLLDKLGVASIHILSQSVGISIGQELLARSDERQRSGEKGAGLSVVSLCMLNGAMFPKLYQPVLFQKIVLQPVLGHAIVRVFTKRFLQLNLDRIFGTKKPEQSYVDAAWALLRHKDGNLAFRRWFFYQRERFEQEDRWVGAIRDTKIQVHYIYGPNDIINPPRTFEEFKVRVPSATYTLLSEDIGHCPMWEDPTATLTAYRNFLQANSFT